MRFTTVLFVCARNAGLSIMAEAYLNHLARPGLRAFSAGLDPAERVHPAALKTLVHAGLAVETLEPKALEVFALPQAPQPDVMVALCPTSQAARGPRWSRPPRRLAWLLGDPTTAAAAGDKIDFRDAFAALRQRIDAALLETPFEAPALALAH